MARATVTLLAMAASLAIVLAGFSAEAHAARRTALAGAKTPTGWWHSLKVKGGSFCGLRDFPPSTNGYGASRLYCIFGSYDHYWMWRVAKASGTGAVASGDEVYLTIYNPMLRYCKTGAQVTCGVTVEEATKFTIEKESGSGAINLVSDSVYLKVGSKYCGLTGKSHSQQLKCSSASKSSATAFQLPASSFASVQLVNTLSKTTCGGDFYGQFSSDPAYVGCVKSYPGFADNVTVALQTPGLPVLGSGSNVTFKAYDDLYSYQVSTWKVDANKKVWMDDNNTKGKSQWFTIVRVTPGDTALVSGAVVAIRSIVSGQFCGVTASNPGSVICDKDGPASALTPGYTYTYVVNS